MNLVCETKNSNLIDLGRALKRKGGETARALLGDA